MNLIFAGIIDILIDGERMSKALKKIEGKRLIFREHTSNGAKKERKRQESN